VEEVRKQNKVGKKKFIAERTKMRWFFSHLCSVWKSSRWLLHHDSSFQGINQMACLWL